MPQELCVLKCSSCETFQSHIVKKTNKWECKICGLKQSIKKVYGRGSGKDCRLHTQTLNALRGEKEHIKLEQEGEEIGSICEKLQNRKSSIESKPVFPRVSKWSQYVDEVNINTESQTSFSEQTFNNSFGTNSGNISKHVKTKRNFDETSLVEEKPFHVGGSESVKNNYSAFSCPSSFLSKKKIKGEIKSTESYTENDSYSVEQDCSDDLFDSGKAEENKPSSFMSAKQVNSDEQYRPSSKWAKYLEKNEDEEELSPKL